MEIADAYAECASITNREARNFSLGIRLLPSSKREALTALYAFARRVDDIADSNESSIIRRGKLEECKTALNELPKAPGGDPVLVALSDSMDRYPIPKCSLLALLEGASWDVEKTRYKSWEELRQYCLRVAGTIGISCTAVYGPLDLERSFPLAETLGIGLQQINIMRDVSEDFMMGRIYLPQDELTNFGVTEAQISDGVVDENWRALMSLQARRSRAYLARGFGLIDLLDHRSSLCVRALAGVYVELLNEIERSGFDVFSERRSPSKLAKLKVLSTGIAGIARGESSHDTVERDVRRSNFCSL